MATSGSIPNPIINPSPRILHYQMTSPSHDSFPSPPIPISSIPSVHLSIFHSRHLQKKAPEAVHVGPAPQPEPGRSLTLSPIPTSATVVSRARPLPGGRATYRRFETIKKKVCATYLFVEAIVSYSRAILNFIPSSFFHKSSFSCCKHVCCSRSQGGH